MRHLRKQHPNHVPIIYMLKDDENKETDEEEMNEDEEYMREEEEGNDEEEYSMEEEAAEEEAVMVENDGNEIQGGVRGEVINGEEEGENKIVIEYV